MTVYWLIADLCIEVSVWCELCSQLMLSLSSCCSCCLLWWWFVLIVSVSSLLLIYLLCCIFQCDPTWMALYGLITVLMCSLTHCVAVVAFKRPQTSVTDITAVVNMIWYDVICHSCSLCCYDWLLLSHWATDTWWCTLCTTGVMYTSECTLCEPGTFSAAGTAKCQVCPRDTFSYQGADSCTPCHNETEYAGPSLSSSHRLVVKWNMQWWHNAVSFVLFRDNWVQFSAYDSNRI